MKTILFVCVENSNRSQMAEAFARIHGRGRVEAASAGSRPSGRINPKAVEAMRERGYDLGTHASKGLEGFDGRSVDVAVTMGCGDECPLVVAGRRVDWKIPDPRDMSPEEFRGVRDLIERKVLELLAEIAPAPLAAAITVRDLLRVLDANPAARMHWMLPDGAFVPAHYHITEVGKVRKDFVDCGGTVRSTTSCLLQVWVAHDVDHRLETTKLAAILRIAAPLLSSDELPVEVEYEEGLISQYPLGGAEVTPSGILFHLGTKHTACLAPDRCGVGDGGGCCEPSAADVRPL